MAGVAGGGRRRTQSWRWDRGQDNTAEQLPDAGGESNLREIQSKKTRTKGEKNKSAQAFKTRGVKGLLTPIFDDGIPESQTQISSQLRRREGIPWGVQGF